MRRAAIATAVLFAVSPLAASPALAAITTTINSSGALEIVVPPGSSGGVSRTYPNSAAETIISSLPSEGGLTSGASIYAVGSVEPPMGDTQFYLFSNVVSNAGAGQVEALTIVRQAITNDSAVARNVTWASELLNGGLSVSWDSATPTAGLSLQAGFDIAISLGATNKYAASGLLDGTNATFSDSALAFNNFRSIQPIGSGEGQLYAWDRTPLTLDLGLFGAGETRMLTYVARTLINVDQFCFDPSLSLCASSFASIGDPPRSGGGVVMNALLARFAFQPPLDTELLQVTLTFSAAQVPEPAGLALLGLGILGIAGARRYPKGLPK